MIEHVQHAPLSEQLSHIANNCAACAGTGRIRHHDGRVSECDCLHMSCTDLRLLAGKVRELETKATQATEGTEDENAEDREIHGR